MHVPASLPARRLYARNDNDGKSGLSTSSIIAIAVVCGCVGILIFTLFLWRLLVRCCKPKKSAPLPPVQDLAHRRQQQSAAFTASRQTQWLEPSKGSLHANDSFKTGSSISLLRTSEKNGSGYIDDSVTAESSVHSPVSSEDEPPLQPPNPMFYPPATANSSPPRQHDQFRVFGWRFLSLGHVALAHPAIFRGAFFPDLSGKQKHLPATSITQHHPFSHAAVIAGTTRFSDIRRHEL